jgi:hypothetical protein
MSEKSEIVLRYRNLALETRTIASSAQSPKDRASLVKLADEYERMARELEAVEATKEILRRMSEASGFAGFGRPETDAA